MKRICSGRVHNSEQIICSKVSPKLKKHKNLEYQMRLMPKQELKIKIQ